MAFDLERRIRYESCTVNVLTEEKAEGFRNDVADAERYGIAWGEDQLDEVDIGESAGTPRLTFISHNLAPEHRGPSPSVPSFHPEFFPFSLKNPNLNASSWQSIEGECCGVVTHGESSVVVCGLKFEFCVRVVQRYGIRAIRGQELCVIWSSWWVAVGMEFQRCSEELMLVRSKFPGVESQLDNGERNLVCSDFAGFAWEC
ncbi:hypothetical protein Droror1_Dr00008341, partial [Drosera rotundifolia]